MDPASALALLKMTSSAGAPGGGSSTPSAMPSITSSAKSGAALDSSGSVYSLQSGSQGDLIVGGSKNNTWMILGAVAIVAFFIFRK
jgi:hypothetical protein